MNLYLSKEHLGNLCEGEFTEITEQGLCVLFVSNMFIKPEVILSHTVHPQRILKI